jgi:phosphoribosyl 1,2-cyclic phosphate phosphodiesterase
MIGCRCRVCRSADPRNRRTRTSAAIRLADPSAPGADPESGPGQGRTILIDTAPELRLQATSCDIDRVDAVFLSHAHADHIMGFDDLRRFCELQRAALPVYAAPQVLGHVQRAFEYALTDAGLGMFGVPVVTWHACLEPVELWRHRVTPVALKHGQHLAWGFRVDSPEGQSLAWCPDCCGIPPESMKLLQGLDALFLDGLRHTPHPTHFTVAEAVEVIRDLRPRRAWLIHMTHDLDHEETERTLPPQIRLAYDGLVVDLSRP